MAWNRADLRNLGCYKRIEGCTGAAYVTHGRRSTRRYMSSQTKKNSDHMQEKKKKTMDHLNTPGDLHETRNKPILDSRRITFPLLPKFILHLLILCYGSRVSNSGNVHPPRNPHALRSKHSTAAVRPDRAFDNPAPASQPHECQACRETERAEICRVPDEAVRA